MIAFIDIETTALEAGYDEKWNKENEAKTQPEILSLGCIYTNDDLNIVDKFELKFRPLYPDMWSSQAEREHGMTWDECQQFPEFVESIPSLFDRISPSCRFVCHALPTYGMTAMIDYRLLFLWCFYYDLREKFYRYFPEEKIESSMWRSINDARSIGLKNRKLNTWGDFLGLEFNHHNALADSEICYEVYKWKKQNKKRDLFGKNQNTRKQKILL